MNFLKLLICPMIMCAGLLAGAQTVTVNPTPRSIVTGEKAFSAPVAIKIDGEKTADADAVVEMHKLAGLARGLYRELGHAAEILIVRVLPPLFDNILVGYIADMHQDEQPDHQAYRLGQSAVVFSKQRFKGFVEHLPVNHAGKQKQRM